MSGRPGPREQVVATLETDPFPYGMADTLFDALAEAAAELGVMLGMRVDRPPDLYGTATSTVALPDETAPGREGIYLAAARAYCITRFDYDAAYVEGGRERHIAYDAAGTARDVWLRAVVDTVLDLARPDGGDVAP